MRKQHKTLPPGQLLSERERGFVRVRISRAGAHFATMPSSAVKKKRDRKRKQETKGGKRSDGVAKASGAGLDGALVVGAGGGDGGGGADDDDEEDDDGGHGAVSEDDADGDDGGGGAAAAAPGGGAAARERWDPRVRPLAEGEVLDYDRCGCRSWCGPAFQLRRCGVRAFSAYARMPPWCWRWVAQQQLGKGRLVCFVRSFLPRGCVCVRVVAVAVLRTF